MRSLRALALAAVVGTVVPTTPLLALQTSADEIRREILESQRRLEEIREERARLQREMSGLRSQVQDVSGELRNIERRLSASRSVLAEIEFQVEATGARVHDATRSLLETREALRERQAVLGRRLRSIYKRGALHTVEVLLGADSFADLLNRYRYLHMMAVHDRSLMQMVRSLEEELAGQTREMHESLAELDRLRHFQLGELAELRQVEAERQHALDLYRSRELQTASRLDELDRDEGRLTGLVDDLERRRLALESSSAEAPAASTLSPGRRGTLDWPVEGELAYPFGVERRPNGTVLRWNGIGIRAPLGAPVRAVESGVVALAGPFEGYGPTVILSHGEGVYTLYLYLEEVGVVEGRTVEAGQVVGTVGGRGTHDGPHIEFQLRAPVDGSGTPTAQDPLEWLRPPLDGGTR